MSLLSYFRAMQDAKTRDTYLGHMRDRNRAMSAIIAARIARNTQGVHHAQQRARAATCAALVMETKAIKFDYLPTPEDG